MTVEGGKGGLEDQVDPMIMMMMMLTIMTSMIKYIINKYILFQCDMLGTFDVSALSNIKSPSSGIYWLSVKTFANS